MLTRCLSARGTTFWSCLRDEAGDLQLAIEFWSGRVDASDSFAESIATSMARTEMSSHKSGELVLLLGVPLIRESQLLGVIEVIQRPTSREAVRAGYLRFMEQMAEIVGSSAAFSP
jgi:hypothetical protein